MFASGLNDRHIQSSAFSMQLNAAGIGCCQGDRRICGYHLFFLSLFSGTDLGQSETLDC
jgi:hypothetical protein